MDRINAFDENNQIIGLLKTFKEFSKYLKAFQSIKPGEANAIEKFERAIKELPAPELLIKALEENITAGRKFIEEVRDIRAQSFKKHETEYIKDLKTEGKHIREYSGGWRVGKLQINVKPELSKVRILFNGEILINWSNISSKTDFAVFEAKADSMLDRESIPGNEIIDILWESFRQSLSHMPDKTNTSLVPIRDFYKEVRIALLRKFLDGKNPTVKIDKHLEFPIWAFLYNLDIYRSLGSKIPDNKKLGLQTGSMQEVSQGKGLVVNGLDPYDEYKVMCYVFAVRGGMDN